MSSISSSSAFVKPTCAVVVSVSDASIGTTSPILTKMRRCSEAIGLIDLRINAEPGIMLVANIEATPKETLTTPPPKSIAGRVMPLTLNVVFLEGFRDVYISLASRVMYVDIKLFVTKFGLAPVSNTAVTRLWP